MSGTLLKRELKTNGKLLALFLAVLTLYGGMITSMFDPKLGESLSDPLKMYLSDIYTVPLNLAGLPGLSMPCGFDETGLPVGAQLIGPPLGEKNVLNAAHAFQMETDWHTRAPAEKEVG